MFQDLFPVLLIGTLNKRLYYCVSKFLNKSNENNYSNLRSKEVLYVGELLNIISYLIMLWKTVHVFNQLGLGNSNII